ncbi:restriction endonuclease subunit S [Lactiplantibacillus plantarum]
MAKIDDSVKKKVPELRFKGFTDEWEERKLKDIAQFNPKTVLPDEFEYVDLESVVGTEMISHRTESKDQAPSRAQRLAQKGDVFYQTVRPYQMNNYLYDLPYDNYVFSTGYAQMRPNIDSYFLLNSVQNKQFVQHVLDRSTGTSYPAINSSDLSNIEIHVPSKLSEQQKIGAFFQSIDDTIALHQRKLDLLKEQKKGYLQKMFPKNGAKVPELRFAGFADDWEQRKLIEVADYRNGKAHEKDISENGDYIVVNSKFVSTNGAVKKFSDELIAPLKKGELAFVLSDVPNGRAIARTFLIDEDNKYSLNQRIAGITPHSDTNSYFLHSLMNRHQYFLRFDDGAGQTNLSKKEVENWTELYPSIEEQDKIGSFFKQLDDTITLHQRKLDLLKEQKKGFLQNMFV